MKLFNWFRHEIVDLTVHDVQRGTVSWTVSENIRTFVLSFWLIRFFIFSNFFRTKNLAHETNSCFFSLKSRNQKNDVFFTGFMENMCFLKVPSKIKEYRLILHPTFVEGKKGEKSDWRGKILKETTCLSLKEHNRHALFWLHHLIRNFAPPKFFGYAQNA